VASRFESWSFMGTHTEDLRLSSFRLSMLAKLITFQMT
jgi:hypothetical protein